MVPGLQSYQLEGTLGIFCANEWEIHLPLQ